MTTRSLLGLALLVTSACAAQRPPLPLPRSVAASCSVGIYGGGRRVTAHANGEVRAERIGPNVTGGDSLARRDSARAHALLDRAARLPWAALQSVPDLRDMQCWLVAEWPDTTRRVAWFPGQPPAGLRDAARLHEEIFALGAGQ